MAYQNLVDASHTHYALETSHYRNAGTIMLPVYGIPPKDQPTRPNGATGYNDKPPVRAKIVRLHAPIECILIKWTAVKEGAAPIVPNPYLFDPNLIFKKGRRSVQVPIELAGYSGNAWSMSGEYEYYMPEPKDLNSSMNTGIVPWEQNIMIDDAVIPNVNFVNSILENMADAPVDLPAPVFVPPDDFSNVPIRA